MKDLIADFITSIFDSFHEKKKREKLGPLGWVLVIIIAIVLALLRLWLALMAGAGVATFVFLYARWSLRARLLDAQVKEFKKLMKRPPTRDEMRRLYRGEWEVPD